MMATGVLPLQVITLLPYWAALHYKAAGSMPGPTGGDDSSLTIPLFCSI
jgi:hypothetical protein